MAKQKPTDAELAEQLAAANEQYAAEVQGLTQKIMQLEAAHKQIVVEAENQRRELADKIELQRRELVDARNEIAAGKPEELRTLRNMNDANINTIADLRRQLREKGK